MKWTGKLVGGVIGAAFGPIGVAVGALLGHQYDTHADDTPRVRGPHRDRRHGSRSEYADVGGRFFAVTFQVMGFVAKSDGRVSEADINAARAVMSQLKLDGPQVHLAIEHFTRGKLAGFDLDMAVLGLRRACADRPELIRVFLELQLRAAFEGSGLEGPARGILQRCASLLGVSPLEFAHLEAVLRIRRAGGEEQRSARTGKPAGMRTEDAYEVLEVEATVSDAELVKAYRRQLSKHHPDKLLANGLPESMLEHAKQRTQQIIEAYELIREHRGLE